MTEVQPLSFGEMGIRDNNLTHTITVAPDNSVSYSDHITPDTQAQRGEYLLTGFPPNMTLHADVTFVTYPFDGGVTIDEETQLVLGGNPEFTVNGFTTNEPTTDGAGNATLYIGATLTLSGSGVEYGDGTYNGAVDLTFYFE